MPGAGRERLEEIVEALVVRAHPELAGRHVDQTASVPLLCELVGALVRLIEQVMNGGRLDVIDELYTPQAAPAARRWIAPFRESFPDVQMEIVDLIAEGEKVVGRFRCSATNLGSWRGQPATGRRFERVDEVYIFRIRDGQITEAWGSRTPARKNGNSGSHPAAEPRSLQALTAALEATLPVAPLLPLMSGRLPWPRAHA